jgi:hypothetical protein
MQDAEGQEVAVVHTKEERLQLRKQETIKKQRDAVEKAVTLKKEQALKVFYGFMVLFFSLSIQKESTAEDPARRVAT